MTDLKNSTRIPDVESENNDIIDQNNETAIKATDFTVDVLFEEGADLVAIELKSVKPNMGEMQNEKRKILQAKAALSHEYPDKNIKYFIGFPFDPTGSDFTEYNKERFLRNCIDGTKFFSTEEILLSEELWDYLSKDKKTMQQILNIMNHICTDAFWEELDYINNFKNRVNDPEKYKGLLEKWCLFKEIELFDKNAVILENINNRKVSKRYNEKVLKVNKEEIKYNESRYNFLKQIIDKERTQLNDKAIQQNLFDY